jgi:hypothetical protein
MMGQAVFGRVALRASERELFNARACAFKAFALSSE